MKKFTILLSILSLAFIMSYAQGVVKFERGKKLNANFKKAITGSQITKEDPAPAWQVTFDEATPVWTIGHSATTEKDWVIGDDASRPCYWGPMNTEENTGWYVVSMDRVYELLGLTETPGNYAYIDIVGDRSAPYNGVELPEGCSMTGTGQNPFDAWIQFDDIDFSAINIPLLKFYNSYRESNAVFFDCFLEYSFDDGASWTSIDINKDIETDDLGMIDGEYTIGLPACAGESNVDIRFRHVSDAAFTPAIFAQYPSSWAWLIDDVRLFDYTDYGIDYDLEVYDARVNFFEYIDYTDPEYDGYNVYHYSSHYGQVPNEQFETGNAFLWFNLALTNNGAETVTPTFNVKVYDPQSNVVFDENVNGNELNFTESDTIDLIEVDCEITNPIKGRYEVVFYAFVDGQEDYSIENNSDTAYFIISDNIFSREADDISGNMTAANWSDGGGDGDGIGAPFSIYYNDTVQSVDVFIDEETTAGGLIQCEIYEYVGGDNPWSSVQASNVITIEEGDLGTWVNIAFENEYSIELDAEEGYREILVGINLYYNEGDIYIGESTGNTYSSYSTYWKFFDGDNKWAGISNYHGGPAIRLNYGRLETSVAINSALKLNIYPNPTTGMLNISGIEGADVQIINMMGQVVESVENLNEYNQIDMSKYANGTYFVKAIVDGNVVTRKINLMK